MKHALWIFFCIILTLLVFAVTYIAATAWLHANTLQTQMDRVVYRVQELEMRVREVETCK